MYTYITHYIYTHTSRVLATNPPLYIYIYICTYIYMYIYIYTYIHTYIPRGSLPPCHELALIYTSIYTNYILHIHSYLAGLCHELALIYIYLYTYIIHHIYIHTSRFFATNSLSNASVFSLCARCMSRRRWWEGEKRKKKILRNSVHVLKNQRAEHFSEFVCLVPGLKRRYKKLKGKKIKNLSVWCLVEKAIKIR